MITSQRIVGHIGFNKWFRLISLNQTTVINMHFWCTYSVWISTMFFIVKIALRYYRAWKARFGLLCKSKKEVSLGLRSILFWRLIDVDLHVSFETYFVNQTYLYRLCIISTDTVLVNISETNGSNRCPLLTKCLFWRKSSKHIRWKSRLQSIYSPRKPAIFCEPQQCLWWPIPTSFGHAVVHSPATAHPSQIIATRQLDALAVPSTHCITNDCIYLQSHLLSWHKLNCDRFTHH